MADIERLISLGMSRRAFVRLAGAAAALPIMGGLLAACGGDDDDSSDADSGGSGSGGEATSGTGTGDATADTGGGAPTAGGELIVGLDSEPPTLDPHTSPSAVSFMITCSVAETLTYLTADRELKPWLAESWEASADGTSYTFKLREDVTFQDGSPFNAESIKGNFDRIIDPNFQAGSALASLAGYTGTDTPDEFTAVVNFETSYAPFLTYTAGGPLGIVSMKAVEELGDDFATKIVTTGQFKVESYTAKDNVSLVRWEDYNRQAPWAESEGPALLDRIVFKFIPESSTRVTTVETGETQLITGVPAQDLARLEDNDDLSVEKKLWSGIPRILILNTSMEPTDDVNVRKAVSLAIDRQALVDTVFAGIGEVSSGMLTRAMMDDESLSQPYDPEQAKQLLEEAGWTGDGTREKDGKKLSFVLNVVDPGSGPPPEAQLIQANLNDVGFDCQIKAQARAPWYEDNYNLATNGPLMFLRSGDYDGLYAMFHSSLIGKNFNFAGLADPEIDAMLEQGRTETDQAARRALYLEICQKLADMAIAAPLVDEYAVWAGKKEVQGLMFNGYTYPQFGMVSVQS